MERFSYINDLGLKMARAIAKRSRTDRVLVHHFAADSTVPAVNDYHKSLGHAGIDYNIVVLSDGTIVWGRGLGTAGGSVNNSNAKTAGMNASSVAVALQGDREHSPMPAAQWQSLCRVVRDLCDFYGLHTPAAILGHDEAAGPGYTDCPGRYVDMDALRAYALGSAPEPAPPQAGDPSPLIPDIAPDYYASHLVKLTSPYMRGNHVWLAQYNLHRHHADPGGIDGIAGPKTIEAVRRFQTARVAENRDIGAVDGIVGRKTAAILAE